MFEGILFQLIVTIYNRGAPPVQLSRVVTECPAKGDVQALFERYNRSWVFYVDVKCDQIRGTVL